MSWRRLRVVMADEWRLTLRRPMVWVLIALVAFMSYGISDGWVGIAISSGDAGVGGKRVYLTSEFALSQIFAIFSWTLYIFFLTAASGLTVIRDAEARVLEVLQATPLTPAEYAWGKFLGVFGGFLTVFVGMVVFLILALSVIPNADMLEARGPFALTNYLKPALIFGIPSLWFAASTAFGVGTATRRPILVFALPIALLLFCGFFLWSWSPAWLSESANRALMVADPAGVRWLRETWLEVDRGADFYNTQRVGYDRWLIANRIGWFLVGLASVLWGVVRYSRAARFAHRVKADDVQRALAAPTLRAEMTTPVSAGATLITRMIAPGFWTSLLTVARAESRELASQPGLYLFVPLILLQILGDASTAIGAFDTPLLLTPGQLASNEFRLMAAYVSLLLIFYGVETLERERSTRLSAIHDALPVPTGALLGGKAIALALVWGVIATASLIGSLIIILVQGRVGFSLAPFALLWGVLLVPTMATVIAFVFAAYGLTKSRYGAYALSLTAIAITFWAVLRGKLSWVSNWALFGTLRWSDMSLLEYDRTALFLNRALWLAIAVALWRLAVRLYPRIDRDAVRIMQGFTWRRAFRRLRPAIPYLIAPVVLAGMTWRQIATGGDGARAEKLGKDYWRKNLATWWGVQLPWVKHADLDIRLDPASRSWRVRGSYLIVNHRDTILDRIPLTVGLWRNVRFAIDGDSIVPDTSSLLRVFKPRVPLGPDDSLTLAFSYEGSHDGSSRRGGGAGEFLLPSGAVMQGWSPRYFPVLGFVEGIGTDDENRFETRTYPSDYWVGTTPALFGSQLPMTVTTRIDVPEHMMANGVGERVHEEVKDGRRLTEWRTDQPVMAFNVVAAAWDVRRGDGTALYFHPAHTYNVDEMIGAMNEARKWYGEWFGAFPWKELKISEFPALATYAQGFPTNITFSEGIGFLTKSDPKTNLAFFVAAHEIAHQWWGNMLTPGAGPGANILSEGTSHFSTALLLEQSKGERAGWEFRKRIETRYGEQRFKDAERKLTLIDGSKQGDNTVTYDKGGWVFYMLSEQMGREATLRGMREFIAKFRGSEDHAVLQDFTAHMRGYAPDTAAYDFFVRQWFDSVVVPEYKVDSTATRQLADSSWETTAHVRNVGTGEMPVDVAVVRGEHFPEDSAQGARTPYQSSRTRVVVAAGQTVVVKVPSRFEPEKVVVDPDVRVLQLRRPSAEARVNKGVRG
jgi:ABC-type transport system involved in multi-copper enzyme maturation permease subunit